MSLFVPPRPAAPALKAGPIGPGAGPLMTEFVLPSVLQTNERQKMDNAIEYGRNVAYIRLAEQVISTKIADPLMGVGWHLEDPEGQTVDATYADARAVAAYTLIAKPMGALADDGPVQSREALWEVTSRHMGLAGNAAWYLSGLNDFKIPEAICYIRPSRLEPVIPRGSTTLTGWLLDKRPGFAGTPLDVEDVLLISLQTPDDGVWAPGLVESALTKAILNGSIDRHFAQVLAGGGRLSGILAPKNGSIENDLVYQQLVRDWRNVTEQPESARRLQVVRAPVEFTKTVLSPDEMKLIDLMAKNRDDLLAVWRVPLSQIGGSSPAGLNSGDVRKYDEAALWQNAVTPRLSRIWTAIQSILDRFEPYLGWAPKLVLDIPEFDDDSPRFDKIQKSQFAPLTNDERRALLGLPPLAEVDPRYADEGLQIIMSNTQVPYDKLGVQPASPSGGQSASERASDAADAAAAKAKTLTDLDQGKVTGGDVTPAVLAALRKQWPANELGIVRQGSWKYDPAYPLKKIDYARRPVARNPQIVSGVEAALAVGAPIDPVVLVNVKRLGISDRKTEPIDGWHRLLAAQHAGLDTVPAYIGKGDDAWTRKLIAFDDAIPTPPDGPNPPPVRGKAGGLRESMTALRQSVTGALLPRIQAAAAGVLADQKRDVVARVRARYDQIRTKPDDTTLWWKGPNGRDDPWDRALTAALVPALSDVATRTRAGVAAAIAPGKAVARMPAPVNPVVAKVLERGAARVSGINRATRDGLAELIAQGVEDEVGPALLGDLIEAWSGWDEYRAERIATTELAAAYNAAAIGSYEDLGVQEVEAIDGTDDEECADRNGQVFTVEEADGIEDHPNGTLDWVPVLPDESGQEGEE